MKKALYVLLPLLIAVGIRLYPTLLTGMPFSTDAWSPIRNTELLIQNTPLPLNSKIFDGYNNFWPANSLFGAVISQVTGINPLEAMPLFFPIIGATAVLFLFAIMRRLYNKNIALLASIIFATAYNNAFFTAAVTKETYANPLYLLLIMIFLHPTIGKNKQILLFTIASFTLALAHHFTSLIAILVLTSLALGNFVNNMKNGVSPKKSDILLILIPTTVTILYYELFAQTGLAMPLTIADWLSLGSFQLLALAVVIYLIYRPTINKNTRLLFIAIAATTSCILFVLLGLTVSYLPTITPTVEESALLYISPLLLAFPFIVVGFNSQRLSGTLAPLFWITPLVALDAFAIFSNSLVGVGLWIRTPDFMCVPAAILTAVGMYWIFERTKSLKTKKLIKLATTAIIIVITAVGFYSMYATVSLQTPDMGYQWVYSKQEFKAGTWITDVATNQTIAGDIKVFYLLHDYFASNVDQLQGFRYLSGDNTTQPPILFTYSQMQKNGYVIALHGLELPANWTQKTTEMNQVYSNEGANIYAGVNKP